MNDQDCDIWRKNQSINPKTKRAIKMNGAVYNKIAKICQDSKTICNKFRANQNVNPYTGRKLNVKATKGIFQQLSDLCKVDENDILDENRKKLVIALKKAIGPVINFKDSMSNRITMYKLISKYISALSPCLDELNDKLILKDNNNEPVITFDKRIGSASIYGSAYMVSGIGLAKLFKFSCKVQLMTDDSYVEELILRELTKNVGNCPHFPIMYQSLYCTNKCNFERCPENVRNRRDYNLLLTELADYDLQTWFKEARTDDEYESVIAQLVIAIYFFHKFGFQHNDLHLGNVLIHKIKPGGYWHYLINNEHIYVKNVGFMIVLWDFGMSSLMQGRSTSLDDYIRPIRLISKISDNDIELYRDLKLIKCPDYIILDIIIPILKIERLLYRFKRYEKMENNDNVDFDDIFIERFIESKSIKSVIYSETENKDIVLMNDVPYEILSEPITSLIK